MSLINVSTPAGLPAEPVQGPPAVHGSPARRPFRTSRLATVRAALDVLALVAALALAFPLRFQFHLLETTPGGLDVPAHLVAGAVWVASVIGAMASYRLYDEDALAGGGQEMRGIRRSVLHGVALTSTAVFLLRFVTVSRGWFVLLVGLSLVLLAVERRAVRGVLERFRARGRLRRPAILVRGAGSPSFHDPAEFDVVGTLSPAELGSWLRTAAGAGRLPAPVVIIDGAADLPNDDLWRLVIEAGDAGSPVLIRSAFRPLPAGRLTTRTLGERTMVKVSPPALTGIHAFEKRVLDLVLALAMALVLAPAAMLAALAVLVTSGRPVLYGQQRVGRDGRVFTMWKFRTMARDAEARTGPVWARAGDPRRTGVGRVLRRLSLDELPQVWNVLLGHMSIVGPRPERPMFVAGFSDGNPWYRFRHRIRPGITGLAQVRGLRGDSPLEPRVESDNWYIEHWSLWLDFTIAARTLLAMARGRNAN